MSVSGEAGPGFRLALRSDEAQVSTPPLFFRAETLHLRGSPSSGPVCNDTASREGCCPPLKAKKGPEEEMGRGWETLLALRRPVALSAWRWFCKEPFCVGPTRLVLGTCRDAGAAPGGAVGRAGLPARICRQLAGTRSRRLRGPERKRG